MTGWQIDRREHRTTNSRDILPFKCGAKADDYWKWWIIVLRTSVQQKIRIVWRLLTPPLHAAKATSIGRKYRERNIEVVPA